jgi:hypothetical protein
MGLHQTEEFLHIKENSHQTQVTACRKGEKSLPDTHTTGINIQNLQGTQKTQPPKNQHPNEEMGT